MAENPSQNSSVDQSQVLGAVVEELDIKKLQNEAENKAENYGKILQDYVYGSGDLESENLRGKALDNAIEIVAEKYQIQGITSANIHEWISEEMEDAYVENILENSSFDEGSHNEQLFKKYGVTIVPNGLKFETGESMYIPKGKYFVSEGANGRLIILTQNLSTLGYDQAIIGNDAEIQFFKEGKEVKSPQSLIADANLPLPKLAEEKIFLIPKNSKLRDFYAGTNINLDEPQSYLELKGDHISSTGMYDPNTKTILFNPHRTGNTSLDTTLNNELVHRFNDELFGTRLDSGNDFLDFEGVKFENNLEVNEFLSDVASVNANPEDLYRILNFFKSGNKENYNATVNFAVKEISNILQTRGQDPKTFMNRLKQGGAPEKVLSDLGIASSDLQEIQKAYMGMGKIVLEHLRRKNKSP